MLRVNMVISVVGGALIVSGCAHRQTDQLLDELPPTAASPAGEEVVIDNNDVAFFTEGPWRPSRSTAGYFGDNYEVIAAGGGDNIAVWNLETIAEYEVYARWTAHPNRASNAEFLVHHISDTGLSEIDRVLVDQRSSGGEWVKLGTYRMSSLTGRVELTDSGNGYIIADAIKFVPLLRGLDTDGDGMTDSFEQQYGLDPNDSSDALSDLDGDGITNLEEHDLKTDPRVQDTDGDGISDGYEISYGLDPLANDALLDSDGDGASNLEEYEAGSAANDAESLPSAGPLVSWTAPAQRMDGSELVKGDIDYYELEFRPVVQEDALIVDDATGFFETIGANVNVSAHNRGYYGTGYHPIPPGNGSVYARWNFFELQPGIAYRVDSRWTEGSNRSTDAQYRVRFAGDSGEELKEGQAVDQTRRGGEWVQVAEFTSTDSSASVELNSSPDGYVIADAVRLTPDVEAQRQVVIVPGTQQSVRLEEELGEGQWVFRVRAVDSLGNTSEYSEPLSVSFP